MELNEAHFGVTIVFSSRNECERVVAAEKNYET